MGLPETKKPSATRYTDKGHQPQSANRRSSEDPDKQIERRREMIAAAVRKRDAKKKVR